MNSIATFGLTAIVFFGLATGLAVNARAAEHFNQFEGKLDFVGMAVQEPTLTYKNDKTGKPFTKDEFIAFADDYLGVDAVFWSVETPWLKE